jgi:hypothetical protein
MDLAANFFYLSLFTRPEAEKHRRDLGCQSPLDKVAVNGNKGYDRSHHAQRFSSRRPEVGCI